MASKGLRVIFLGAPGVGKGSFASKIGPMFNLPIISTGDLVRKEIKANTPLGQRIKALNDQGKLVDDATIVKMASDRLAQEQHGFILDGFPRTVPQAQMLATLTPLDAVIDLVLRQDILVLKACSRRVCKACGEGYNLANIQNGDMVMPPLLPKKEGVCDKCSGELIQRADDTEAVVKQRLEVYNKQTSPLIEFYKKQGILKEFHIKKGMGDLPELVKMFESMGAKPIKK